MSITYELREEAQGYGRYVYTPPQAEHLTDIADRIDAEHERTIASVMNDALYHANEKDMAELGWIRLPKDADGEVIHIGDVMEWIDLDGETLTVKGIGNGMLFYTDCGSVKWTVARNKRHYHEPTVEDVLLDACKAYHSLMVESMSDVAHDMPAPSEVIAEFAAKLRLAGDAE